MNTFLLSEYSFTRYIPTILSIIIVMIIFFQKKPKSTEYYFGLYFVCSLLQNISYFFVYSIYNSTAIIFWYIIALCPVGIIFLMLYAYNYSKNIHMKESRIAIPFFTVLYIMTVIDYTYNVLNSPIISTETHYGTAYTTPFIPPLVLVMYIWCAGIFLRKSLYYNKASSAKKTVFSVKKVLSPFNINSIITIEYFYVVMFEIINAICILTFLQFNIISFKTANYFTGFAYLISTFAYITIYINHLKKSTSVLMKISIIFITTLLFLSGIGVYLFFNKINTLQLKNEMAIIENNILKLDISDKHNFDSIDLIINLNNSDIIYSTFIPNENDAVKIWQKTPKIKDIIQHSENPPITSLINKRFFAKYGDRNLYAYVVQHDSVYYLTAFDSIIYKRFSHKAIMSIIISSTILLVIVTILIPIIFNYSFNKPLHRIINGIRKVNEGNLDVVLPIKYSDDIGYITMSFNTMISTMRSDKELLQSVRRYICRDIWRI